MRALQRTGQLPPRLAPAALKLDLVKINMQDLLSFLDKAVSLAAHSEFRN